MGFIALKCPSCGAEISLDDSREFGFCQYCGTKVVQDKQVIEHRGSVKIDRDQEIANLLIRARTLVNQNRVLDAGDYYRRVLERDALNAEALQGLKLAESIITEPNLVVRRLSSFCAKDGKVNVVIDGEKVTKISDGEQLVLTVPTGEHQIMFYVTGYGKNKPVPFTIEGSYTKVNIAFKVKMMCKVDVSVDIKNVKTQ